MLDKQYRDVYKYIYFFNYKNEDVCVPVYYYDTKISSKHSEVGGCGGGGVGHGHQAFAGSYIFALL